MNGVPRREDMVPLQYTSSVVTILSIYTNSGFEDFVVGSPFLLHASDPVRLPFPL